MQWLGGKDAGAQVQIMDRFVPLLRKSALTLAIFCKSLQSSWCFERCTPSKRLSPFRKLRFRNPHLAPRLHIMRVNPAHFHLLPRLTEVSAFPPPRFTESVPTGILLLQMADNSIN